MNLSLLHSSRQVPLRISTRIVVSIALFSMMLGGLMMLSHLFVLPQLTSVDIDGKSHSPIELQSFVSELSLKAELLESKREELVTPLRGSVYGVLRSEKVGPDVFVLLKQEIHAISASIVSTTTDVVHVDRYTWDQDSQTLRITGRIHNVGPRSMTVLGQFVERLKNAPFVTSVEPPTFTRHKNEDGSQFSPFDISIVVSS